MADSKLDDFLLMILVIVGVFGGLLALSFTNTGSVLLSGLGDLFRDVFRAVLS